MCDVLSACSDLQLAELNALVAAGLASGEVKPLPVTVYPRTEVEEAFRYLASGKAARPFLHQLQTFHNSTFNT